jgi:hypothetical protein
MTTPTKPISQSQSQDLYEDLIDAVERYREIGLTEATIINTVDRLLNELIDRKA